MSVQYTLFMILAPLSAIVSLVVIVYAWRHRTAPGALVLTWQMIAITGWLILSVLELADPTEAGTILWAKLQYPFVALASVAWVAFALQYTGHGAWLKPSRIVLLGFMPLINSLMALTNDWHHLIWKTYDFIPVNNGWLFFNVTAHGLWYWVHIAYSYGLVLAGALIITREYFRSSQLYRRQSLWAVIGAVGPIAFDVVYSFRLIPGFHLDYSPVAFAMAGLAFAIAIFRYRLFDLRPVARHALVESMTDGMLVLDERNLIVDLNRAAQEILGVSIGKAIGQPAARVLNAWQALVNGFKDQATVQAEISFDRDGVRRYYDLRVSPLTDSRGPLLGRLIVLRDMTERKRAELALLESEEKMRQVTSSMREAVWLRDARTLELLYVNPAYETIWGRSIESFYRDPTSFLDAVHPEDKARVMEAVKRQYEGIPFAQEYRIVRPDGSVCWIWGRTFLIKNEAGQLYRAAAVAEDVTERKITEQALRENESHLRALANALPDLVFILDRDGRYLKVPETFPELVLRPGTRPLLGSLVHEVLPRDVADNFMSVVRRTIETGQPQSLEYQLDVPAGRRWFEGRTAPMAREGGKIELVVWGARDITERKQAEEALRQANLELQARNEELDTFGHTVAHDLKNPLGTIVGYANTLVDYHDTLSEGEQLQSAQTIVQVGMKVNGIIEELMLLAGLHQAHVEMGPLDMASVLADVRLRLESLIGKHHAEVIWPDVSGWPTAVGYGPWVEEVWVNYLSNAVNYGGRPPRVELDAIPQSDGMIRFRVRDNGLGLSPEAQARLFIPFERLDQVRATGHGLGLSIVRRIVEKMGGRVSVESDRVPGHGCTFSFTLPVAE